ncbi:MAG: TolC family protein [Bacteroidota bacterium]
MIRFLSFASALLFFGFMPFGKNAHLHGQEALSMSQAIQKGLENNYNIKIAETRTDIARNNNTWANAGRYPTIDFSLAFNNSFRDLSNPAGPVTGSSTFSTSAIPGVTLNWTLFNGHRVKYTKNQFEQQELLNQGNAQIAVENTIQAVILAYYNALVQKEQLEVIENVLKLSRDRIEYQEVRQEFGQAGTFDILQTADAYLNDSTTYILQVNTFETALRNLNLAMGEDNLSIPYQLTDELSSPIENYEFETLEQRMFAGNYQLRNQLVNQQLASINTQVQESAFLPSVQLQSGVNYNIGLSLGNQTLQFGDTPPFTQDIPQIAARTFNGFLNVTATYPIVDFGVRRTRVDNAKAEELVAQLNIDELKRNLRNQLANTLATFNNQKQIVQLTEALIQNAEQNLTIAEERFKGGLINSFDFRSIQLSYLNASQSKLTAIFNLKNTETELIRLIGGLVQ